MKNSILPRTSGFFLVTLIPVVCLHLVKLPIFSEFIDAVISGIAFSISFAFGILLARKTGFYAMRSLRQERLSGAVSAALMWSLLWVVWSIIPTGIREHAAPWAFFSHLAVSFGIGYLSGTLWTGQASTA